MKINKYLIEVLQKGGTNMLKLNLLGVLHILISYYFILPSHSEIHR